MVRAGDGHDRARQLVLAVEAQQAGKVYRIGVLASGDSPTWEAFRQALRQLGYVEGSNTAIEWRWSEVGTLPGLRGRAGLETTVSPVKGWKPEDCAVG
jgi:hypothetical protein